MVATTTCTEMTLETVDEMVMPRSLIANLTCKLGTAVAPTRLMKTAMWAAKKSFALCHGGCNDYHVGYHVDIPVPPKKEVTKIPTKASQRKAFAGGEHHFLLQNRLKPLTVMISLVLVLVAVGDPSKPHAHARLRKRAAHLVVAMEVEEDHLSNQQHEMLP